MLDFFEFNLYCEIHAYDKSLIKIKYSLFESIKAYLVLF